MTTPRPAVFLDRDGVVNRAIVVDGTPYSPMTVAEFEFVDGALDACRALADASIPIVVVSNQPEIARGHLDPAVLEEMHGILRAAAPVLAVLFCPHDDADGCDCRKPRPGMLLRAASEFGLDLQRSAMVGDRWSDIEAARRAGCRSVLIGDGYAVRPHGVHPDAQSTSLLDAVPQLLQQLSLEPS